MDDAALSEFSVPESILQPLFTASNSSALETALERLVEIARSVDGRSDLASKNFLPTVLKLCQSLSYSSCRDTLLLSLKLLRNLCAGELSNQTLFVEQNGVQMISKVLSSIRDASDSDYGIIRMGLQVLANVSLAGEKHQGAIWHHFFPVGFIEIARVRSRDTCDPLCMIIYTCSEGNHGLTYELCSDNALPILAEIIHTASEVGSGEDWFKLLVSKTCIEESHFAPVFSKLPAFAASGKSEDSLFRADLFTGEQAFLLSIVSEILNERIGDITVSSVFALGVVGIFRSACRVVNCVSEVKSGLPSGSADIDVLGYSLSMLRDICACDGLGDVVDSLLSSGLLDLLLDLLRDLEPPAIIRKAMKAGESGEGKTFLGKLCPYKGFRRDIVAVIGNCIYRRKHVQDRIREKNGVLLMLQQCVIDEDNSFLREWGIWAVRNLLEGNAENQRVVSELELQGSVDLPEIAGLGLRVEVDQKTRRAKLVNIS